MLGIAASTLAQIAWAAYADGAPTPAGFSPLALPGLSNGTYINQNAAALVGTQTLGGQLVLVLAFRGSDDQTDWLNDVQNINADYAKFSPLISAVESYAAQNSLKVVVTGHSLGGAMAQVFMANHPAGGAVKYEAVTFGSPGALVPPASDHRITNYVVSDDPLVFLGLHREEVGQLLQSNPLLAIVVAEELSDYSGVPTELLLAALPTLTENYNNRGETVLLTPPGRVPLTLDTLLTADPNEHEPALYAALAAAAQEPEAGQSLHDILLAHPDDTTGVATVTYQFFTGIIPDQNGFEYLVNSPDNQTDLTDAYYAGFNQENRYLNFAANLGLHGQGATEFQADYGALSFEQAVHKAYDEIVGFDNALEVGNTEAEVMSFFVSARSFYEAVATERVLPGNSQISLAEATKVVAVGSILNEAIKADLGNYAEAYESFLVDLTDGQAHFGVNLLTAYSASPSVSFEGV